MRQQKYAAILAAMQTAHATSADSGLTHEQLKKLTGLSGPQVSNALFQFYHRKAIGRDRVEIVPGLPRVYRYWYVGEPRKARRRQSAKHVGNGTSRAGAAFEVNVTGPEMSLKRTLNAHQVQQLVGWLIK